MGLKAEVISTIRPLRRFFIRGTTARQSASGAIKSASMVANVAQGKILDVFLGRQVKIAADQDVNFAESLGRRVHQGLRLLLGHDPRVPDSPRRSPAPRRDPRLPSWHATVRPASAKAVAAGQPPLLDGVRNEGDFAVNHLNPFTATSFTDVP
jgi:hypothetical protein